MAKSIRIKSIDQRGEYWHIRVGKSHIEIPGKNKAALRQWIREQFRESDDFLLALGLAAWIERDPQMDSPDIVVGKTITLDLTGNLSQADGIVRVS